MANTVKRSALTTWIVDPIEPTAARPAFQPKHGSRSWGIMLLISLGLLAVSAVGW